MDELEEHGLTAVALTPSVHAVYGIGALKLLTALSWVTPKNKTRK